MKWMWCIYSENRRGIYFSPQKRLKHGRQNIMLHWISGIIRNNKCIFTKLNAVFILKNGCMNKKNITTVNSVTNRNTWSIQQTPMFHGCTITNKQNFRHHGATPRFLVHLDQRSRWTIAITWRPSSVNFSHFKLLLRNHWANWNQT